MYGETYELFVKKFNAPRPKTTDDCYTPVEIYDAIAEWVSNEYQLDASKFIRPFWPDSDYTDFNYPNGCVVVDNPPFSILSKIVDFYLLNKIDFFLFAPSLTIFAVTRNRKICAVVCNNNITYQNGAKVNTSFVTNLEPDLVCRTAPTLSETIKRVQNKEKKKQKVRQYFPGNLIRSTDLTYMDNHGIDFRVPRDEACFIRSLEYMQATKNRENGRKERGIFGGGFLISDAAAESVVRMPIPDDVIKVPLSPREQYIIAELNKAHARTLDN